MGVELFVKGKQYRMGSAGSWAELMKEIAQYGEYPAILDRVWWAGEIKKNVGETDSLFVTDINILANEVKELKKQPLSPDSREMLDKLDRVVKKAIKEKTKIAFGLFGPKEWEGLEDLL